MNTSTSDKPKIIHRVVARFSDGRVLKGQQVEFSLTDSSFLLRPLGKKKPEAVDLKDLKAVYYVKSFDGRPFYRKVRGFVSPDTVGGQRVIVRFADGEELYGTTRLYSTDDPGFFVYPSDPDSNSARIFVINGPSLAEVKFTD
ncbi:MAG: hypothetical protein HUU55_12450 [Myxococcales bacterium]|nr:hypothetical protein [Myxococcales bacterium]